MNLINRIWTLVQTMMHGFNQRVVAAFFIGAFTLLMLVLYVTGLLSLGR